MMLLIPLAAIALLGVLGLAIGLRGRRTDDHPLCRRCRFDLIGLAAPADCPECGASLADGRALRIGNRQRRRGITAAGLALILLALVGAGGALWSVRSGYNWNTVKPAWWLARDAEGSDAAAAIAALDELLRRIDAGTLGAERHAALVQRALDRQADRTQQWITQWGDIIERADTAGLLTPADRSRALRGAIEVSLLPRARVRSGDDLPIDVGQTFRLGSASPVAYRVILTDIRLGDRRLGPPGTFHMEGMVAPMPGVSGAYVPAYQHQMLVADIGFPPVGPVIGKPPRLAADAEPGRRTLRTRWVISAGPPATTTAGPGASSTWCTYTWSPTPRGPLSWLTRGREETAAHDDPTTMEARLLRGDAIHFSNDPGNYLAKGPEVESWVVECNAEIEIVPRDVETIDLITAESQQAAVQKSARVVIAAPRSPFGTAGRTCEISFMIPPMDMAFEVIHRTSAGEHRLGAVVARPSVSGVAATLPLRRDPTRTDAQGYHIILRPSPDVARRTYDITRIWGHELSFTALRPPDKDSPGAAPTDAPPVTGDDAAP